MCTNIRQNYDNKIFSTNWTHVAMYAQGHLCTNFERFILIYEALIAKKWVWPSFSCTVGQSHSIVIKRKPNMSCHLLNVFTKFQIDISENVEKSPENSVGWTVRWMDIVSAWYHYFSNSHVKWSQTCETGGALRTYIFPPRSNSEAYGPLGNDSSPRLFRPHPYSRPVLLNANMCSSPQATYSTATLNLRQQNSRVTGRNDLIISYF